MCASQGFMCLHSGWCLHWLPNFYVPSPDPFTQPLAMKIVTPSKDCHPCSLRILNPIGKSQRMKFFEMKFLGPIIALGLIAVTVPFGSAAIFGGKSKPKPVAKQAKRSLCKPGNKAGKARGAKAAKSCARGVPISTSGMAVSTGSQNKVMPSRNPISADSHANTRSKVRIDDLKGLGGAAGRPPIMPEAVQGRVGCSNC